MSIEKFLILNNRKRSDTWETIKGYTIAIVGGLAISAVIILVCYALIQILIDTGRAIVH